jgi:tetratricopeptide (TPR) repeat protein
VHLYYLDTMRAIIIMITVLTSAIAWWLYFRSLTSEEIYDSHFEPYVIQTVPRGLEHELDEYMLGLIYYRDGDYNEAIALFGKVLEISPFDYRVKLLIGISYLALKDFEHAEQFLKPLVNDNAHLFQDQARWYLGLTYLTDQNKENDGEAAVYFAGIDSSQLLEKSRQLSK